MGEQRGQKVYNHSSIGTLQAENDDISKAEFELLRVQVLPARWGEYTRLVERL